MVKHFLPSVHVLGVEGDVTSPVRGPSPLSHTVPRIICAQALHSLSSSSPQHPADRCYLCCYYPSSNKATPFFPVWAVRHYIATVFSLFFPFSDQQPRKTQICPNTVDSVGGSFMSSECNETVSKKRNCLNIYTLFYFDFIMEIRPCMRTYMMH